MKSIYLKDAWRDEILYSLFCLKIVASVVFPGKDLSFLRSIHEEMLRETEYHGSMWLAMFGISALDRAIWDCLGKAMGVTCWKLWGAVNHRIPAYAMVGWLNYSDKEVQEICSRAVDQGSLAVKIKVGYPSLREDIDRIDTVRKAVGLDIQLMVDANKSLLTVAGLFSSTSWPVCPTRSLETGMIPSDSPLKLEVGCA